MTIQQVISDDELRYENNETVKSSIRHQNESRARYIYDSRESVPVQIVRNKTLNSRFTTTFVEPKQTRNPEQDDDQLSEPEL